MNTLLGARSGLLGRAPSELGNVKSFSAVDIRSGEVDLVLAIVDDFAPAAVEERHDSMRVFFSSPAARDSARAALAEANYSVESVDVDDEDWARRSQEQLRPITVGRITVAPPWASQSSVASRQPPVASLPSEVRSRQSRVEGIEPLTIVIEPSMGFGTGHHATTRLCLEALQGIDLVNRFVLDVGTGSGVLALAANRLGAAGAVGIDSDPDAIQSARENLRLNPGAGDVTFRMADLRTDLRTGFPLADVVTANLTGALLAREAAALALAVRPGGFLVISGLLADERAAVVKAFAPARVVWERTEDEWVGLALRVPAVKQS